MVTVYIHITCIHYGYSIAIDDNIVIQVADDRMALVGRDDAEMGIMSRTRLPPEW